MIGEHSVNYHRTWSQAYEEDHCIWMQAYEEENEFLGIAMLLC